VPGIVAYVSAPTPIFAHTPVNAHMVKRATILGALCIMIRHHPVKVFLNIKVPRI